MYVRRSLLGTAGRVCVPSAAVAVVLAVLGHPIDALLVLAATVPTLLVVARYDATSASRRFTRLYDAVEAATVDGYGPTADMLRADRAALSPEELLITAVEGMRRSTAAAHHSAAAARDRARFTRAGIAELFAKRIHAEEGAMAALAGELHDTVVQSLVTAQIALETGQVDMGLEEVRLAEQQLRAFMAQTSPPDLHTDFATATRDMFAEITRRHGVHVTVTAWPDANHDLPTPAALTVYRFLQETLTNVAKHAGVPTAQVAVHREPDHLVASVHDDGNGFNVQAVRPAGGRHVGLHLLNDRAKSLGGRTSITSAPGKGTTATLRLPLTGGAGGD